MKKCLQCKQQFISKSKSKFCSEECRIIFKNLESNSKWKNREKNPKARIPASNHKWKNPYSWRKIIKGIQGALLPFKERGDS